MFSSFKNTELLRYFVRVDLNKNIDKLIKQNKSNFSLIAGSIFSGSFSILGTYFGIHGSEFANWGKVVLSSALFSFLFFIGMYIFKGAILFASFIINGAKKEKLPSKAKIKEFIDDFDHIACDNILISQNFIEAYHHKNTTNNLKEFYFYEIIYYTKVSISIIQKLLVNKNCITDKNNTNRVHLYRLENALKMLNEIYIFLKENQANIDVDQLLIHSLDTEISDLEKKLITLNTKCDEIKKEKYLS